MLNKYIVVKPIYGLKRGEVLVFNEKINSYEFSQEEATENATSVRRISVSSKSIESLINEGFIKADKEAETTETPYDKFSKEELYKMLRERDIKFEIALSKIDKLHTNLNTLINGYEEEIEGANDDYLAGEIPNYKRMEAITTLQNLIHFAKKINKALEEV